MPILLILKEKTIRLVTCLVGLFQFINLESSMPITGGKKIPYHSLIADVSFNNVTFAYPTRPQQVSSGTTHTEGTDCKSVM
jgi:ATP-binding cassette subfamily B (MDR/TAP) protein 8